MALLKVRKQGTSVAVTLTPETLRRAGLREGDLVQQDVDERGRVVLTAVTVQARPRRKMIDAIKQAARKERSVLRRLEAYDRGC